MKKSEEKVQNTSSKARLPKNRRETPGSDRANNLWRGRARHHMLAHGGVLNPLPRGREAIKAPGFSKRTGQDRTGQHRKRKKQT